MRKQAHRFQSLDSGKEKHSAGESCEYVAQSESFFCIWHRHNERILINSIAL
jgi:hypothetical protein